MLLRQCIRAKPELTCYAIAMNKKRNLIIILVVIIIIAIGAVSFFVWNVSRTNNQQTPSPQNTQSSTDTSGSGLSRSQITTQTKNDVSRFAAAVTEYVSNNSGSYPANQAAVESLVNDYLGGPTQFKSPATGQAYAVVLTDATSQGTINLLRGKCNSSYDGVVAAESSRQYAVLTVLPSDNVYCIDL